MRQVIVESFGASAVTIALLIAVVATAGSLYLSEVAHFVPCKLCWYQRIVMYPLPVLLASAMIWRDDATAAQAYGLNAYPYFAVVNAAGNLAFRATGELNTTQLAQLVAIAKS